MRDEGKSMVEATVSVKRGRIGRGREGNLSKIKVECDEGRWGGERPAQEVGEKRKRRGEERR